MPQTIQFPLRHTLFAAEGVVLCLIKLWCPVKIFVDSSCHNVIFLCRWTKPLLVDMHEVNWGGWEALRKCQVSIFVKAPRVQFSAIQVNTLKNNFCPEASSNGACQSEINFLTRPARAYKWNQRLATSDHPCPSLLCSANGDFTGDISPIQSGKIAAVKREKERKRLRTEAILNLLNMARGADEKRTLATSRTLI